MVLVKQTEKEVHKQMYGVVRTLGGNSEKSLRVKALVSPGLLYLGSKTVADLL